MVAEYVVCKQESEKTNSVFVVVVVNLNRKEKKSLYERKQTVFWYSSNFQNSSVTQSFSFL